MRIQADLNPDPGPTLKSQKLKFYMKNTLTVWKRSKNIPTKVKKRFWKAGNEVYFLVLVSSVSSVPDP